jgi:predicted RNA-binding protein with PIN domain
MKLIVDAYNLIKQVFGTKRVSDHELHNIIAILKRYARKKNIFLEMIFDGGISNWLSKEQHEGVTVIYVGRGHSADDYIKEYLEEHKNADFLLVSSDHELNVCASRNGIYSIDVYDFWFFVESACKKRIAVTPQTPFIKITDTQNSELDQLMTAADNRVPAKEDDGVTEAHKEMRKISKQDTLLLQKIKKL